MAARVDLAVELFPGVVAAPLLLGSIAGTGGRFSIDPILAAIGELPGGRPLRPACWAAQCSVLLRICRFTRLHGGLCASMQGTPVPVREQTGCVFRFF